MKRFLSIFLAVMMVVTLFGCGKKAAPADSAAWQEQFDLGVRYLSEGNYEEAIIAFTAAIKIDPKQVPAYLQLADVYMELDDVDSAIAILESGYAETGDEALREYLDALTGGRKPPQEEQNLGPHGETVFESRKQYQAYDTLTAEQQALLAEIITALQAADREALNALALRFVELFESQDEELSVRNLVTRNDTYKIHAAIEQNSLDNMWLTVQIRPENGMGYHVEIQPESWLGAESNSLNAWTYASCPCVNWQPEGEFFRESEEYQYYEEITAYLTHTESGTAAGGVILASTSSGRYENQTTGEVDEYTSESTYENGHLVVSDGPTEAFWTPFSGPGSTSSRIDDIFW